MIVLVAILLYCAGGFVWTFRKQVRYSRRQWRTVFGWDDVLFAAMIGLAMCWAWPVQILIAFITRFDAYAFARRVGGETADERADRRERDLRARDKRIAALEAELGLRDGEER